MHDMSFERNAKDGLFQSRCKCKPDRFAQGGRDYSEVVFVHQIFNKIINANETEYETKTYNQRGGLLDNETLKKK